MNTKALHRKQHSDWLEGTLFLAPTFLLIILITYIPIVIAMRTSLHSTSYAVVKEFVGFKNYAAIFRSGIAWKNILNSIEYVFLSLLIAVPLGVGVGSLLNRKLHGIGALRTLLIIPWVLSQTVTALLFKWILNGNYGPLMYWFYQMSGVKIDFFSNGTLAKLVVVLANVWNSVPVIIILVLAALQSVPTEIHEAAHVDGATGWKAYTAITLPLIKPTIVTAIVMQSMEYFNMVTLIYVLTAGGPMNATQTLSVAAFQNGFDFWHLDTATAYSMIIFLLNILFSLIYIKLMRSADH